MVALAIYFGLYHHTTDSIETKLMIVLMIAIFGWAALEPLLHYINRKELLIITEMGLVQKYVSGNEIEIKWNEISEIRENKFQARMELIGKDLQNKILIEYQLKPFGEIVQLIQSYLDINGCTVAIQPCIAYRNYFITYNQPYDVPEKVIWERFDKHRKMKLQRVKKSLLGGLLVPIGLSVFIYLETELSRLAGFWITYLGAFFLFVSTLGFWKNRNELSFEQWKRIRDDFTKKEWWQPLLKPLITYIFLLLLLFLLFRIFKWGLYTYL